MLAIAAILALAAVGPCLAQLQAGVFKYNGSLPIGVPLAGYNHGQRRVPDWPIPVNTQYTTWMTPSIGRVDPTWVKALVIDTGSETFAFVTIDAIGAESAMRLLAYDKLLGLGITSISLDNFMIHGAHTHSGPGAITPNFLWSFAPATDIMVPELQDALATSIAYAVSQAIASQQLALVGTGSGLLTNVTLNRRAGESPYLKPDDIDPNLGIIRVDALDGTPIATVWNFAIHGTCNGPENMMTAGDIMGGACEAIENLVGGVALFINGDAGDIDPQPWACQGCPNSYAGAPTIAAAVKKTRDSITATADMAITSYSQIVPFGHTLLNISLSRWDNCTSGGPLDICTLCEAIHCEWNANLNSGWINENPRFTALRFSSGNNHTLFVTIPGEALSGLGWEIRNDSAALGFTTTLLSGYSNDHMGYFATGQEYDVGGYESELTFWGYNTSVLVRNACKLVATQVAP